MPDDLLHTSHAVSDLEKNRALLDWLRWQVGQTERRVRGLEIQEAQERARRERARAEMAWKIQPQRSSSAALLHRGGCATYPDQVGLISREDAMVALAESRTSSRARSADRRPDS
ncbi:DUF6233 domain-containing protein [[Kitasatospora] papulosa]